MARLKYLDDWARAFLSVPRESVELLFPDSHIVELSIQQLPFYTRYRAGFRRVSPDLLLALHAHMRGTRHEWAIWDALLGFLDHALPDEIANDLIERGIAVSMLGHSRQSDAVMWRLAPMVDEALLTMAKEIYTRDVHDASEMEQVLARFPSHEWLLSSLSHCRPSSEEKRAAYFHAIEGHPKRDEWMPYSREHAADVWPLPHERPSRYEVPRPLDADGIRLLSNTDPSSWLDLARSQDTPLDILQGLANVRCVEDAAAIRHAARVNLREQGLDPDAAPQDQPEAL